MASYGEGGVPLNASEFGWTAHVNTGTEQNWERGVTEDQQAAYTLCGYEILGAFPQVAAAHVFTDRDFSTSNWWGDRFGLLRADLTKKVGYYALKCVASAVCGPQQLTAPTGLQAQTSQGRVTLSWNGVAGATGYRVYRSATGEATHRSPRSRRQPGRHRCRAGDHVHLHGHLAERQRRERAVRAPLGDHPARGPGGTDGRHRDSHEHDHDADRRAR